MIHYVVRRVLWMVVGLVMVSIVTFGLLNVVPGDFFSIVTRQAVTQASATASAEQQWKEQHGLDGPAWEQYLTYMWRLVRLDVGPSYQYPTTPVETIIAERFPVSAQLALLAVAVALLVGLPLGIVAALKRNSWIDYLTMFFSTIGYAVPNYIAAVLLVLLFSLQFQWLPTSGWGSPKHLLMPVAALAIGPIASIARYTRVSLVITLNQDYIRTAYAKGGRERTVIVAHALRNSLIPVVTILGPTLSGLLVGSVLIETIFRIPGLGNYVASAAANRDVPLLMTSTLFYAALVMALNLVVDITYGVLDPQIRHE